MFTCYYCHVKFPTSGVLLKHLNRNCKYRQVQGANEYRCGEAKCFRHFSSSLSLRRHLNRLHKQVDIILPEDEAYTADPCHVIEPAPQGCDDNASMINDLGWQYSKIISQLYADPQLPRKLVQTVVTSTKNLLITFVSNLQSGLKSSNCNPQGTTDSSQDILALSVQQLEKFKSHYKRIQFFESVGTYIAPIEVVVGQRMDRKRSLLGTQMVTVPSTKQVISISVVLKQFFEMPGLLKQTLSYMKELDKTPIVNVTQGPVWKKIVSKHVGRHINLPIVLYYDDYEVSNCLSSHATIHKLGGVYVSLPSLPPHLVSQLKSIFVLAIFHASDKAKFGNRIIFQSVIDQLNALSQDGVLVKSDAYEGILKFHVVVITGDNLGLHSILGFVESFKANYCCRICTVRKEVMQRMTIQDNSLLRNKSNYEKQLLVDDVKQTGIKEKCIWSDLKGFDLFEHVSVDILHDFLEGCCRYVMHYVVNYLVKEAKLISSHILQARLSSFNFGPDSSARPSSALLFDGSNVTVKTSASEMLTLVRYFALIVGYNVTNDSEVWSLFITLRMLLDRLLNSRVFPETTEQLEGLVQELNESYIKLAATHLKPKFHFMVHYPDMLAKFGPLTQVWTMRFEAKHRISKIAARVTCNKINICKTLAIKNQLLINDILLNGKVKQVIQYGKLTVLGPESGALVSSKLQIPMSDDISTVPWVIVKGFKFIRGYVVTLDLCLETHLPYLGEICEIYIVNHCAYYKCQLLQCIEFDNHFYAYEVKRTEKTVYVKHQDLMAPAPNHLTILQDLTMYVTLRWPIN